MKPIHIFLIKYFPGKNSKKTFYGQKMFAKLINKMELKLKNMIIII